jgi:hypothetical protein
MAIEKDPFDDEYHDHIDDPEQQDKIAIDLSPELRKRIEQAAHKGGNA